MAPVHDREILRLALPAFLALVAEPLFLLADAAIVGHLGTPQLAGLGIAAVVLQTAVGLCVFLAYGTTASVARRVGAGDHKGALVQGVDGVWLAVLIGVVVTVLGLAVTGPLVRAFGAGSSVEGFATTAGGPVARVASTASESSGKPTWKRSAAAAAGETKRDWAPFR